LSDALKFVVRYQRKVQPQPYENLTIGLEREFLDSDVNKDTAFRMVRNQVEYWIHESLNCGEKP
jgi:hypothetical protein